MSSLSKRKRIDVENRKKFSKFSQARACPAQLVITLCDIQSVSPHKAADRSWGYMGPFFMKICAFFSSRFGLQEKNGFQEYKASPWAPKEEVF